VVRRFQSGWRLSESHWHRERLGGDEA
jgi:hypothetical protein